VVSGTCKQKKEEEEKGSNHTSTFIETIVVDVGHQSLLHVTTNTKGEARVHIFNPVLNVPATNNKRRLGLDVTISRKRV
jgi:hypothetical protein